MKYVFLIYSIFLLLSCSNSNKVGESNSKDHLFVLDFDKFSEKDSLLMSSFITSVTPIILETTENNLIGFLTDMQVTQDYICILDGGPGGSGNLFVFDKRGKFLRKIGQRGQGPGEYVHIRDFTIDEEKDKVILADDESEKIRVYKLSTGEFVKNIDIKNDQVSYRHIQYNDNSIFTNITYFSRTEKGPMLYKLDENDGDIKAKYLDIDIHNHGWLKSFFKGESFFYCKNSENPKYIHYFMDTMMVINKGVVEPYFVVKSKDWVTRDDVINNKNMTNNAEEDALIKIGKSPIEFNIHNYVESNNYIYFTYSKNRETFHAVYDKKKEIVLRTKLLLDDVMFDSRMSGNIQLIGCGDDNGMYGYINTVAVPSFNDYIIKDSSSSIRPEYRKIFDDKITADSNPIILYYEYKK